MDFRRIIDALSDAVIVADSTHRIAYASAGVQCLLGWSPRELVGQPLTELVPARMHVEHLEGFKRFLATHRSRWTGQTIRLPARRRDGEEVEIELRLEQVASGVETGGDLVIATLRATHPREDHRSWPDVARWLRAVTSAAAHLRTRGESSRWIESVVEVLVFEFDAALARLWLVEAETNRLVVSATAGPADTDVIQRDIDLAWPPSRFDEIIRRQGPFVRHGLEGDPDYDQDWVKRERIVASVAFPLYDGDKFLGVLSLFSRTRLEPEAVSALEALAAIVTAGLCDLQLIQRARALQAEAEAQRRKLQALFDTVPFGVLLVEGRDRQVSMVNPAGEQIGGREFVAESFDQFLMNVPVCNPDGSPIPMEQRPLWRALHRGESVEQTVRCRLSSGHDHLLELHAMPFPGPDGGAVEFFRDVTEEWRLRGELAERAGQVKALLDHLPVGVAYFDYRGICRAANGPARRILGRPRDEATASELFAQSPILQAALSHCLDGQGPHAAPGVAWNVPGGSGRTLYLDCRLEPLPAPPGGSTGALALLVDVTDRKLAADQLRRAAEQAESASRTKSQFLSALSHDLRTPVNGLCLQTEWLTRLVTQQPTSELTTLASEIRLATTNLSELVNDLLELTVFDSGALAYRPTEFPLDAWLEATVAPLRLAAQEKHLELACCVDWPGRVIRADRVKLGRVLTNLVGNALKFTEKGSVTVTLGRTPDGWLELTVTDTGPGIPETERGRIFDEFAQLRNPERDRTKGTGLGLAICRRLVEGAGGVLTVESELGRGSRFTALFPPDHFPESPTSAMDMPSVPPLSTQVPAPISPGRPILLVEDDPFSRRALAHLLEAEGYEVVTAADGPAALEAAASREPALVLLDLMLPGMDGAEVLRNLRIRADRNRLPVIILSGDVLSGGRSDELQALDVNGLLSKPVELDALLAALHHWAGPPASGTRP